MRAWGKSMVPSCQFPHVRLGLTLKKSIVLGFFFFLTNLLSLNSCPLILRNFQDLKNHLLSFDACCFPFLKKQNKTNKKKLILFLLEDNCFAILCVCVCVCVFCHTSTWIIHDCTCVPLDWIPTHLPPYLIPLGCPRTLTLSTQLHALNLHWSSLLHMAIYMFQWYSLKSSYPHLLLRVQKSILYICLSFAALHIRMPIPSF